MVSKIFNNILNEIKLLKMDFYYMNENSLMRGGISAKLFFAKKKLKKCSPFNQARLA